MKRFGILWGLLLFGLLAARPARAQDQPLQTPDAQIVAPGVLRAQVGFDFLNGIQYPLTGLSGDLASMGVLNLRLGMGRRIEVQLQGTLQNYLQVDKEVPAPVTPTLRGPHSTNDYGNFSLWTKLLVRGEHRAPGVGFRFGFEMPNAKQSHGIGNNSTNVYGSVILEKHFGNLAAWTNAGIGIMQASNTKFSQNDELIYGGALAYPLTARLSLVGEVAGRYSARSITPALYGTESRGEGRMGIVVSAWGFRWNAAAVAGVYPNDPSTGIVFGVSRDVRIFGRREH